MTFDAAQAEMYELIASYTQLKLAIDAIDRQMAILNDRKRELFYEHPTLRFRRERVPIERRDGER